MLNDGGRLIGAKGKLSSRMAKCKFAQCAKKRKQNPAAAATTAAVLGQGQTFRSYKQHQLESF